LVGAKLAGDAAETGQHQEADAHDQHAVSTTVIGEHAGGIGSQ
jgi:hypothetical protein